VIEKVFRMDCLMPEIQTVRFNKNVHPFVNHIVLIG